MANRVGQRLGNYYLLQLLGQGGFADVYLGQHIHLGTQAAIKVLHTQLASDHIELFRNEARTIARLEHPHIVRVLDFGVEDNTPFLVMSYAPNGTLRKQHPRGTRLQPVTIVSYIRQIAPALQFAHDQKLIHRDIKPENLLVGRQNEILLSDFGIALMAQSSRNLSAQDMAGTIAYMAPEQIQAHPRSASDQYSLGIVVYEWLSGQQPFQGSYVEIAIKHSVTPPPSLRELRPELPPAVEQVVMRALAKDAKQRFASIQDFANALVQACQGAPLDRMTLPLPSPPGIMQYGKEPSPGGSDNSFTPQPAFPTPPAQNPVPAGSAPFITESARPPSPRAEPGQADLPITETKRPTLPLVQPKRSGRIIILVGLVLLLIIGGSGLIYALRGNSNVPSSLTAGNRSRNTSTPINQSTFTAIAGTQSASTAPAQAIATLNAATSNPYPPHKGTLTVNHPLNSTTEGWDVSSGANKPDCQFSGGAYHVKGASLCSYASSSFNNYTYQVQMTFLTADTCGGIVFSLSASFVTTYSEFFICTDGSYHLTDVNVLSSSLLQGYTTLNTRVGQTNVIAVVANGPIIDLYINGQKINSMTFKTSNAGAGTLGVGVYGLTDHGPAEIAFNDARVWTF